MATRTIIPKLTLDAAGGPEKVLAGLQITGGATEVSAAAWIVWKHRKAFHAKGVCDFNISERSPMPRWFSAGIVALRERDQSWNVITLNKGGRIVTYRVVWLNWRAQRSRGKG